MALTTPYHRIGPWWRRARRPAPAWVEPTVAAARLVASALVGLWRWLLADPARFRAATQGLAVCLLVGAVIGWSVGAVVIKTVAAMIHVVSTGP